MAQNLDEISSQLASVYRRSSNIWSGVNSSWHDSLSIQFEATYWTPIMNSYQSLEKAIDELSGQVSYILSKLP